MVSKYLIYNDGLLMETRNKDSWTDEQIIAYATAHYDNFFIRGLDSKKTTIKVTHDVKSKLDSLKTHPRETYEDIIIRLINHFEKE